MDSSGGTNSPQSLTKVAGRRPIRDESTKGASMPDYREKLRKPGIGGSGNFRSNLSYNEFEYMSSSSDDEIERSPSPMLSNSDNAALGTKRSRLTASPGRRNTALEKKRSLSPTPLFRHNIPNKDNIVLESEEVPTDSRNSNLCSYVIYIIIASFAILFGLNFRTVTSSAEEPISEQKTCEELTVTNKNFLKQIDYMALKISVENTIFKKPTKPSVFVFLQDDRAYTNKAMDEIVNVTTTCFGSEAKFIKLDTGYFTSKDLTEDHGVAIEHVKDEFKNGGVLWVPDLDKIPAKVARAFHAICDTYSPLVEKLIVYFTLTPTKKEGNPTKLAEDTLRLLWKQELNSNELDPLITRVTDQVLWIHRAKM